MSAIHIAEAVIASIVVAYIGFWVFQATQMKKSGYLTPGPFFLARITMCWMARALNFVFVGPVRVVGRDKAKRMRGPLIFTPNHTHEMDFALVRRAVGGSFRFMAAAHQLFGLRAFFGAWAGAFPMNFYEKGGGSQAVKTSVKVLSGSRTTNKLLVFPQGKLIRDNVLRDEEFKGGVVRISKLAMAENGKEVVLVPIGLHYIRDAQKAHWSQRIFGRLRRMYGQQNYGAVVVVGDPIPVSSLPQDERQAINVVREKIQTCLTEAEALA